MFESIKKSEDELKLIRKTHTSPSRFISWLDNPYSFLNTYFFKMKQEDTPALLLGRKVHSALPHLVRKIKGFEDEVKIVREPDVNKRTKAGKEELAKFQEENKDNIVVNEEEEKIIQSLEIELEVTLGKEIRKSRCHFEVPIYSHGLQGFVDMIIEGDGYVKPVELKTSGVRTGSIFDSITYQKKKNYLIQEIFYLKTLARLMAREAAWSRFTLRGLQWVIVQTNHPYSCESLTSHSSLVTAYSTYVDDKLLDYFDFVDRLNQKFGDDWILNDEYKGDYHSDMKKLKEIVNPHGVMKQIPYDKRDSFVMV